MPVILECSRSSKTTDASTSYQDFHRVSSGGRVSVVLVESRKSRSLSLAIRKRQCRGQDSDEKVGQSITDPGQQGLTRTGCVQSVQQASADLRCAFKIALRACLHTSAPLESMWLLLQLYVTSYNSCIKHNRPGSSYTRPLRLHQDYLKLSYPLLRARNPRYRSSPLRHRSAFVDSHWVSRSPMRVDELLFGTGTKSCCSDHRRST